MANCTDAVKGIVDAVFRYRTDAQKNSFSDNPDLRRKVTGYTIQSLTKKLNQYPFRVDGCDVADEVIARLIEEGYMN